ncbi:CPBP family intramembrane metalloprotease [Candidatus Saccharibacteria bacterium]|nr:CPBP family intramembrane metalloprotease [Candidatus Saccharibacteria bacterium]
MEKVGEEARDNLPKKPWKKTALAVALMIIWVFCSVVVSQLVVGLIMGAILGKDILLPVWSGVYSALSYGLALLLVIFVPAKANAKWHIIYTGKKHKVNASGKKILPPVDREQIGLMGTPTWMDIGLAPVGYIVGTLLAMLMTFVFSLIPWFDASEAQVTGFTPYMTGPEKIIAFITLVVLAPVAEEIIFRGWLYGKMRARLNAPVSIILVSLLFAVMHFQWNVGVDVFALSVVLCVMREITGTIYSGILTHMLKNGIAFYLLYVLGI